MDGLRTRFSLHLTPSFLWAVGLSVALLGFSGAAWSIDCNGNDIEDVVDIGDGLSRDCNDNSIPDECEVPTVKFAPPTEIQPIASTPRFIETADLDGDGDIDMVAGSRTGQESTLTFLFNEGRDTFLAEVGYRGAESLYSLAIDDLDGDGDLDLATANRTVLLTFENKGNTVNDNGQERATFEEPGRYTLAHETRFVTTADTNSDGMVDLLITNRNTQTISVLVNRADGSGTFEDPVDFVVGENPVFIAAGDFDGDDTLDLVTANRGSRDFSVLLNPGDGGFETVVHYPANGSNPSDLAVGDFNGDGALDLAARRSAAVDILLNQGDGSFGETASHARSGAGLSAGDFDGDGDLDLAMGNLPASVVVKLNDGRGNFDFSVSSLVDRLVLSLATDDLDGDGALDLAVVTAGPDAAAVLWNVDSTLSVTTETQELVTCPSLFGRGCWPHSGAVADIDNDGDVDLVACNTHPGSFSVAKNDGSGKLSAGPAAGFGGQRHLYVALGHLDDDKNLDAVTTDNQEHKLYVHPGNGDGTFGVPAIYDVGQGPIHCALADFDDDGHLDVASANLSDSTVTLFFNQGDGTLNHPDRQDDIRVGISPHAIVALDIDGDGYQDLAVAASGVTVLTNRGDGTFTEGVSYRTITSPNYIVFGDFDRDDDLDLATSHRDSKSASVLLNDGSGTYSTAGSYDIGQSPFSLSAADVDGDGALDLVTANDGDHSVSILLGLGDGAFELEEHFATGQQPRYALVADLDNDGDSDVVTTNRAGRSFTVLYNSPVELNAPDYLETVCTEIGFQQLSSRLSGSGPRKRFLKYTLPATDDPAALPTVFQNTKRFPLHQEFLTSAFPERFPVLTSDTYNALVGRRETRQYFVGTVTRIATAGGPFYAFSIFADFEDIVERLTAAEVKAIFDRLALSFQSEPLAYFPDTPAAIDVARGWSESGFPIYFEESGSSTASYEAYTRGVGFGRVRVLDRRQFAAANDRGGLTFQDVLVLDHAPTDIEGVVSGVVTEVRQNPGSHLTVRTRRRGTPNAFLKDATMEFGALDGELVRLEVKSGEYRLRPATLEEAESWWSATRPVLTVEPSVDPDFTGFPSLLEVAAMDAEGNAALPTEARFGGKCTNFARLQSILDGPFERYREKGFGIPVHYYLEFLRSNRLPSELEPTREVTYEEYLNELFVESRFQTESSFRFAALERLREDMEDRGQVDPELIQMLAARVGEVLGSVPTTRVRFRSSSNIEDAIEFNGAGLYDSTSGCPADDLDLDNRGPSRCDPDRDGERGISRALKRVWASLWNFRAYEERAFYGIPQKLAAMGILVNRRFSDEAANGVAFTGSPTNPSDGRYVVTAQPGDESVVSPESGVFAEQNLLELEDGKVVRIVRAVASTLVPAGTVILSDADLEELGGLLWHIDQNFSMDLGQIRREEVVLDVEFKKLSNGELAVKQVRPLLLTETEPTPTFELEIPPGTVACGIFEQSRTPRQEYELKSLCRFVGGSIPLTTAVESFSGELFDEVIFGSEREIAMPVEAGTFRVNRFPGRDGLTSYEFEYEQQFELADGDRLTLSLSRLNFQARDSQPVDGHLLLTEELLTDERLLRSSVETTLPEEASRIHDVFYSSCDHEALPLWEVRAELGDGSTLRLEERFRPESTRNVGPASLTLADIDLRGSRAQVSEYWNLVYSAQRHNLEVKYWIVLDPPVAIAGIERPVHVVELIAPEAVSGITEEARYLDESFEVLAELEVVSFQRGIKEIQETTFLRGDVDASGTADGLDIIPLLGYLFLSAPEPQCTQAADANDDGRINITDAVWIALHQFRGKALPPPHLTCGVDTTADDLSCVEFGVCE